MSGTAPFKHAVTRTSTPPPHVGGVSRSPSPSRDLHTLAAPILQILTQMRRRDTGQSCTEFYRPAQSCICRLSLSVTGQNPVAWPQTNCETVQTYPSAKTLPCSVRFPSHLVQEGKIKPTMLPRYSGCNLLKKHATTVFKYFVILFSTVFLNLKNSCESNYFQVCQKPCLHKVFNSWQICGIIRQLIIEWN